MLSAVAASFGVKRSARRMKQKHDWDASTSNGRRKCDGRSALSMTKDSIECRRNAGATHVSEVRTFAVCGPREATQANMR